MTRWNEAKFAAMREKSHALNLYARDLSERIRDARRELASLQTQIDGYGPIRNGVGRMTGTPAPPRLYAELEEQKERVAKLQTTYEKAADAWTQHGNIVRRCEEYASEHLGWKPR